MTEVALVDISPADTGGIGPVSRSTTREPAGREDRLVLSAVFEYRVAAATPYAGNWATWRTGVMPLKKAQNSLDTGIPEVAEEEWEKDPVVQAAMRDARGAYRRGEYRTFDEYVADRRRRSR